jgi:peroxiredoxin
MRNMFMSAAASLALALLPVAALAAPEIGKPAPDFTGTTMEGKTVKLSEQKGKIVVLEWHNPGCPFVKKHYESNNMQQLQAYAKGKDVVWMSINSGAEGKQGSMKADEAKAMFTENKLAASHYILDGAGTIGKLYEAKTTPHMYVIDAKGNLAYMGAIDSNSSADPKTIKGATNYVRAALDAIAAGKTPEVTTSTAYGCSVKYAD